MRSSINARASWNVRCRNMINCGLCRSKAGAKFDGLFGMVAGGAGEIVI
jgi:hypothetical protein